MLLQPVITQHVQQGGFSYNVGHVKSTNSYLHYQDQGTQPFHSCCKDLNYEHALFPSQTQAAQYIPEPIEEEHSRYNKKYGVYVTQTFWLTAISINRRAAYRPLFFFGLARLQQDEQKESRTSAYRQR